MAALSRLAVLLAATAVNGGVSVTHGDAATGSLRGPIGPDPLRKVKDIIKMRLQASQDKLAEESTQATMCKAQLDDVKARLQKQTTVVETAMKKLNEAKATNNKDLKDKLREAQHQQIDAESALDRAKRGIKSQEADDLKLLQTAAAPANLQNDPYHSGLRDRLLHGKPLFPKAGHSKQGSQKRAAKQATKPAPAKVPHSVHAMLAKRTVETLDSPEEEDKKREAEKALDEAKYELKQEMKSLKNVNKEYEILHDECMKNAGQEQTYEMRQAAREAEIDNLNKAYDVLGDK